MIGAVVTLNPMSTDPQYEALTDEAVFVNVAHDMGPSSEHLVHWWAFDEPSGIVAFDLGKQPAPRQHKRCH